MRTKSLKLLRKRKKLPKNKIPKIKNLPFLQTGGFSVSEESAGYVALAAAVAAGGYQRAVSQQSQRMVSTGIDGDNIGPAAHTAFAVEIIAGGDYGAVCPQTYGMGITRTDGHDV